MATPATPPSFGVDISATPDVDPTFTVITDPGRVVGEAVARRYTTPRGGLSYSSQYGRDLRDYMNAPWSQASQYQMQQDAEREAEKDERITQADATATYLPSTTLAGAAVTLNVQLTTVTGQTLTLVLNVTSVTVALLSVS